ncbi:MULTISPECIES: LysR family transcriptional regulator [unclassified Variovorax]|uniref:LysR family transcriptional regulator n=1 Tax=unclassified Variovorax TaxID=663243 RepID=UPI001BD42453|nr:MULTISPECIES: LysR family transcriptional regulator [unclassified Variovorax]
MHKLNVDNFDLNLLAVFLKLWETRSVTRASDKLALSQPAVSHALRRLRDALGDELFVSSKEGLVPTARGESLVAPVREALAQIGLALQAGEAFVPSLAQREFRIGAGDMVEFSMAPQLIEEVAREAPGILIKLVAVPEGDLGRQLLESGQVDAVIDGQAVKGSGVRSEVAAEIGLVTLIWKREKLVKRRFPLELYLKRPHIVIRTPERRGTIVDQTLAERGLKRPIGAIAQHFISMPVIAARTGYICNLPSGMGATFADLFGLSVHEPPLPFAPSPLYLSWHKRFEADQALAWMLQKIRHVVADVA